MNYKYISIPTSRLSEEWLKNNNFDPEEDIDTFITYYISTDSCDHYDFLGPAHEDFICNTQKEFEQMVSESKLSRII